MPPDRKVAVTYTDEFGVWDSIRDELYSKFPLRNLVWKSASSSPRPSRTIPILDLEVKKLQSNSGSMHQMPSTLLEKPFMNLYFVKCDDNEVYRSTVRRLIKEWLNNISAKKNQEWLIVQVTSQNESKSSGFLNMKGTVLDKIKADFNSSKRDRCALIRHQRGSVSDEDSWNDFLTKLKEGITSGFDQHVVSYEEDIRRLDSQRTLPGWNYCTFFILKEGLSLSFELMNLFEDALIQYDELEASFFQILRDKALAWFGNQGGNEDGDDSSSVLDVTKKPYREMILKNTISVFDFQCYLFGRQCLLLGSMRRPVDILRRAKHFIATVSSTMKENMGGNLSTNFLESWIYSCAMNIVDECEKLAPLSGLDSISYPPFNSAKAGLLDIARNQLDKIGIQSGLLPYELPFSMALSENPSELVVDEAEAALDTKKHPTVTNQVIKSIMDDSTKFDDLYRQVTKRAMVAYAASGWQRSMHKLEGDIACLDFHREHYSEAVQVLEKLPYMFGESGWHALESNLLTKCGKCQMILNQPSRYVITCLTLLQSIWCLTNDQIETYAKSVAEIAKNLPREIVRPMSPSFQVHIIKMEYRLDVDTRILKVDVLNNMGAPFWIDTIHVNAIDNRKTPVQFSITLQSQLLSGKTELDLQCNSTSDGTYVLQSVLLRCGKVVFEQPLTHLPLHQRQLLNVPRSPDSADVEIRSSKIIDLLQSPSFVIIIKTAKTEISQASISLAIKQAGAQLAMDKASFSDESTNKCSLESSETSLKLSNLETDKNYEITVPYWTTLELSELDFSITFSFTTIKGGNLTVKKKQTLTIALPLAVNVQDFFREGCLFSKFIVSCGDNIPLRVISTHLEPTSEVTIVQPLAVEDMSPHIIFSNQVGSYIYKIQPSSKAITGETLLRFDIKYRSLKQEVEAILEIKLETYLKEKSMTHLLQISKKILMKKVISIIDYVQYGMTDAFQLPSAESMNLRSALSTYEHSIRTSLTTILEDFLIANTIIEFEQDPSALQEITRAIYIPVELPNVMLLNTVEMIIDTSKCHRVGDIFEVTLKIRHSARWCKEPQTLQDKIEFYFEVHADFEAWLLNGAKRYKFVGNVTESQNFDLVLLPLRAGHLTLPVVSVSVVDAEKKNMSCETNMVNGNQTVLVLPKSTKTTFFIESHQQHSQIPQTAR